VGTTLLIHIGAGGVAIVAGYMALFAAKGAWLHRRAGVLFVCAMLVMGLTASALSLASGAEGTGLGGLLVVYMVLTALTTVRRRTTAMRRLDVGLMALGLAVSLGMIAAGARASAGPATTGGAPAGAGVINGMILLLAVAGDLRVMRAGGLRGGARLARHLWRMCFAMFMATGSFFLGQADEIPERFRVWPALAVLALLPLLVMPYWLRRVRRRPSPRAAVAIREPEPVSSAIPAGVG
jgi:uncharacterized membrane protein